MAQVLALLSLLKRLMSKEVSSFSSVGLNNFLFCILFIMSGDAVSGTRQSAFWSTLLLQLVLLAPLLVTFSIDTQHRLPIQRVASWPLTETKRLLLTSMSFVLNPLFIVLFAGVLLWMGFAIALAFVLLGLVVHVTVFALGRLLASLKKRRGLRVWRTAFKGGGIAQEMWRELTGTLDFWAAFLVALSGTLYRLFGRSPEPEAFPILALVVGIAMSTVNQRTFSLDGGRALLRYRLLPIPGWKLLITQDFILLLPLLFMVSFLSLRTGLAFGLVAIAVGRYPSLMQQVSQRRWRFIGGDPRYGAAQVVLGGAAGMAAARVSLWAEVVAFLFYAGSVVWGERLWNRSAIPSRWE